MKNKLKESLQQGNSVYGPFCKIQDPTIVEIAALSNFDFVIIDMEHGPFSIESTQNMVRAAEARGITPVVRVIVLAVAGVPFAVMVATLAAMPAVV